MGNSKRYFELNIETGKRDSPTSECPSRRRLTPLVGFHPPDWRVERQQCETVN